MSKDLDTVSVTKEPPVAKQPTEQPEKPLHQSSAVISRSNTSPDLPQSSLVMTKENLTPPDNQSKILGITVPLPNFNIIIVNSEETKKQV